LKKIISNLCLEKECLEKSKDEDYIKIETIEIEKKELKTKCEDLEKNGFKIFLRAKQLGQVTWVTKNAL